MRKAITIRTVSAGTFRGRFTQAEYIARMSEIQRVAAAATDMGAKTSAFWKMENLSAAFLKQAQPGQSLNDPSMPVEIRPIAHCGMGIAALELAGFSPGRLAQVIEPFSNPECRLFAYEGTGAMLALYEPDLFGMMAKTCGALKVLPMAALRYPDPRAFVGAFEPEIRRLIAYGYGRMLYFKKGSIAAAIRAAHRAPYLETAQCVQGIAFACAMVNNGDLESVFRTGFLLREEDSGPAFADGLIYALMFWEWMAPGFLDALAPANPFENSLVNCARAGIEAGLVRGRLAPFALEPYTPRSE